MNTSLKPKRVQLDLSDSAFLRLKNVKDRMEASSYTEVIKNALRLLEALLDEDDKGSTLLIRRKNGELVEYKIFV